MQCHQPLLGIGYPSPGQYLPFNPVNSFNGLAPEIIGEGEVNSITFPDGSIQYYFSPIRQSDVYFKQGPPYPFYDSCNFRPSTGVWIIRNFSNTISPVYNQYWQRTNYEHYNKPCFRYENIVEPSGFQLKFHNDCWTSTTDLHYFCKYEYKPPVAIATTCSAAVQVDPPKPKSSYQNMQVGNDDSSELLRQQNEMKQNIIRIRCDCNKYVKDRPSSMSIDKSKTSSSCTCLKKSRSRKKKHSTPSPSKSRKLSGNVISESDLPSSANEDRKTKSNKSSKVVCECATYDSANKMSKRSKRNKECIIKGNTDKAVTTYTDQASNVKEVEGQTQTGGDCPCSATTVDLNSSVDKLWMPKIIPCKNRNKAKEPSEHIIGVCEFSSTSDSNSTTSFLNR